MELKIEGMMCQMCAKRVKKALEAVSGEGTRTINLEEKSATVTAPAEMAEALKKAVEEAGYQVVGTL